MNFELWVALVAAAGAGAAVVALLIKGKQVAALQTDLTQRQEQLAAARAENAALARDNKWLGESDQKLRDTFQALAAEALKDNRSSFLDLARTSFEQYQQPISETLRKIGLQVDVAPGDL